MNRWDYANETTDRFVSIFGIDLYRFVYNNRAAISIDVKIRGAKNLFKEPAPPIILYDDDIISIKHPSLYKSGYPALEDGYKIQN
tara:strand:+ start:21 stop:275 length:255 start_codon:yes stop_codon:yes gene_type:complete